QPVADFDDAASWVFSAARATGSVTGTPAGRAGGGLALGYDFTGSTATRAAYAAPPRPLGVPGGPQSFRLWIDGDGMGAWPTLHFEDATGSEQLLRGPHVTWTGWRQVTFTVPQGAAMPWTFQRFYLVETVATRQYTGRVVVDGLTAQVPPPVALPDPAPRTDPLIGTAAAVQGRRWRFAFMSDAQFVARDPGSATVARARRTLREIRAARPDFVVVGGDLVDEGSPADLAFARRVLTEELGEDLPWYYVPGNHEVMGGGIEHFTAEFGPAHRVFDHRGTRFLTLDTSALGLRGSGVGQVRWLRQQLESAATDASVGAVLVVAHVPPRDPTVQRASQLVDRREAAYLERRLAEFHRVSGKGVGFLGGHVGAFSADRVDGVPYFVNGNSGKDPAVPPGEGGFTGWSLVGVDPVTPAEQAAALHRPWRGQSGWFSVQTRPHVDGLALRA
ncbi:metallophosphoesterase family protein, partial [Streptomyces sparsus]